MKIAQLWFCHGIRKHDGAGAMALLRGMVFVKYVAFKEVIIEGD